MLGIRCCKRVYVLLHVYAVKLFLFYLQAWCQVLHVFTYFCMLCNYFWMFCEGLYLHTILLRVFSTGRRLMVTCHLIGWGILLLLRSSIFNGLPYCYSNSYSSVSFSLHYTYFFLIR